MKIWTAGERLLAEDLNGNFAGDSGTFTPAVVGGTTPGVGTYSVQYGRWWKLGRLVFIEIGLVWSAHTGTGSLKIGPLPFTVDMPAAGANPRAVIGQAITNVLTGAPAIAGTASTDPTHLFLFSSTADSTIAIDTAASVFIGGCYRAAS